MTDHEEKTTSMYSRMLVPLDGSRLAESVLPVVRRLAAVENAVVILLHVLERDPPSAVHGQHHLTSPGEGEAYLARIAGELRAGGIQVEIHSHPAPEGDVARSICEHAQEERADLIVLCTHGGGSVRQFLFGSIAQQVLARGSTPVFLVRPLADGSELVFAPQVVLVPLDGTTEGEVALQPAAQISRDLGASLHLVMVIPAVRPGSAMLPSASRAVMQREQDSAAGYLTRLAARLRTPQLEVTTEVRRGTTTATLAEEAAEPGVGLVVVATHGRAGVQAVWAGSVTARLLSRTRAPILLLRQVED